MRKIGFIFMAFLSFALFSLSTHATDSLTASKATFEVQVSHVAPTLEKYCGNGGDLKINFHQHGLMPEVFEPQAKQTAQRKSYLNIKSVRIHLTKYSHFKYNELPV